MFDLLGDLGAAATGYLHQNPNPFFGVPKSWQPETEPEDARYVANDGTWGTAIWSALTGEKRDPTTLSGMAADIGDQKIKDFEIVGHGSEGSQNVGGYDLESFDKLPPEEKAALLAITKQMSPDGQIVLGGCNVARNDGTTDGTEMMKKLAMATGKPVTAGTSLQLPLPGIEGTEITVYPPAHPGDPPRVVKKTSATAKAYDWAAGWVESFL
jgi:hypothetical protein